MIITDRSTPWVCSTIVASIAMATSLTFIPNAWADPDPHIPNGAAGWCPGGQQHPYGLTYCLGQPFPDGTFYEQSFGIVASQPFRGPQWARYASCSSPGGCGGGPATIYY